MLLSEHDHPHRQKPGLPSQTEHIIEQLSDLALVPAATLRDRRVIRRAQPGGQLVGHILKARSLNPRATTCSRGEPGRRATADATTLLPRGYTVDNQGHVHSSELRNPPNISPIPRPQLSCTPGSWLVSVCV